MKASRTRCPKCGQYGLDLGLKHCGRCNASVFHSNDSPPSFLDNWFMWLVKGPRGTGWYRKASIQILFPDAI